eukprot:CAMPEP_0196815310 /NCGR_PEP_ID=MMETSP1362-20130617/48959_1 /TAXON_ID=163516 /ORGANISM="Leptocylindrus danicus, Strain CCMP1856" /LENGTH=341 /DNA_ID=CAMNT_0042192219 /DNA_START=139 /DNA_END=1165 /DNA_ORIENTATION=+
MPTLQHVYQSARSFSRRELEPSDDGSSSCSRVGRWTIHEEVVVDELCRFFNNGDLPLENGTKLNDFLSSFLDCKASRLTKKLKNGNLSKTYERKIGYLRKDEAFEFSQILEAFLLVFPELKNEKIWREHFLNICIEKNIIIKNAPQFVTSLDNSDSRPCKKMKFSAVAAAASSVASTGACTSIPESTEACTFPTDAQFSSEEYFDVAKLISDDFANSISDDDMSKAPNDTAMQLIHFEHKKSETCNEDSLVSLLGEYMPLDGNFEGYTNLRLMILKEDQRTLMEDEIVTVILRSYSKYLESGAPRSNVASLLVQEFLILSNTMLNSDSAASLFGLPSSIES